MENAISVRIGREGVADWDVDMYNNSVALTMLDYLSGSALFRFYFEDVEGADITATPIGYFVDTQGLTDAVQEAHTANLDDTWGVEVYFLITKTLE